MVQRNNSSLTILMVVTIVLLFVGMVMSSMASTALREDVPDIEKASRFSTFSAIAFGVAALIIAGGLAFFVYGAETGRFLGKTGGFLERRYGQI